MREAWCIIAVLAVPGCIDPVEPQLPRIRLELSRNTIEDVSTNIAIRAVMENTADQDFVYWHASCQQPVVKVHGTGIEGGSAILHGIEGPRACAAATVQARLQPGERQEGAYVWNGAADPANPNSPRAIPGEYTVVASLRGVEPNGWNVTSQRTVWIMS